MSNQHANGWGVVHRVRLGHVRKLLQFRYGVELPYDDAGIEDLRILLHVKAQCYAPDRREKALLDEISLTAPWLAKDKAEQIAAKIAANPIKLTADTLGSSKMLNLDWMTREQLRIWQIGAMDAPADYRKQKRRQRDRERKWCKRRAEGRIDRAEYLAAHSANRTKPWVREGISRRAYYYRKAKGTLTQPQITYATPVQCSAA